jgi:hypothetical protein
VVLSILVFVTSAPCILQCWEKGIPLCKELAELYERRLFDYAKLSQILRTQAKFFDNILTQLRPEPEYFRVGFYGLSFPLFVRVRHIFMLFYKFMLETLPTMRSPFYQVSDVWHSKFVPLKLSVMALLSPTE